MATHQPRFSSAIPPSCGPECCEAVEGLLGAMALVWGDESQATSSHILESPISLFDRRHLFVPTWTAHRSCAQWRSRVVARPSRSDLPLTGHEHSGSLQR
jgi:hypothetical protein